MLFLFRSRLVLMVIELFICTFSLKMLPCGNIDMLSLGMCHNGKLRIIYLCFTNENTNISKKCFMALRCPQGRLNMFLNYNKLIWPQNFVTPCNLEPIWRWRPCFRYFKTSWSNLVFSLLRSLKYLILPAISEELTPENVKPSFSALK